MPGNPDREAQRVRKSAGGRPADETDAARSQITEEYVPVSGCVSGDQVGGIRREGNEPPVRRHERVIAHPVGLDSRHRPADESRDARPPVAHEDVALAIPVVGHEVVGPTAECHDVPIAGH
jgi:hypothetical protein